MKSIFFAVVLTLFAGALYGDDNAAPPAGMGRYIMVVRTTANAGRGKAPSTPPKDYKEPDVTKHGGQVLRSLGAWRVIHLPLQAAKHLRADENVAALQRVWMGESLDGWDESQTLSLANDPEPPMNAVDTNLSWGPKSYVYNGSGSIREITGGTQPDTFLYDDVDRLKSAVVNGVAQAYQYDSFGNIRKIDTAGQPSTVLNVDSASNRLSDVTYDVAGNVTTGAPGAGSTLRPQYAYDSMSMVTAITNSVVSKRTIYTPDEERIGFISNDLNSTGLWTIRDFGGRPLRQYRGDLQAEWLWEQDWIYAGGALVGSERGGQTTLSYGSRLHYHLDHLGSVRLITSENRTAVGVHDYFPFGVEQTVSIQEELNFGDREPALPEAKKFTGHERDFLGDLNVESNDYLDYMHARYYSPVMGRFLSVDPEMNPEKIKYEPQQWNRYSYVTNNPLKYTDPDGKDKFMAWLLGGAFKDVSTWDALKGALTSQHAGPSMSQAAGDWAEDHREMTGGFSPVPTTQGEIAIAPVFMMLGPAGGAARTTLAEAKMLVGAWGKGTFSTLAKTIGHHFQKHGAEVGAKNTLQYLRKAAEFGRNTKGATKTFLENGATRYEKAGRYIIKDKDGKIVSFGAV